jgi:hypothetical protein
MAIFRRRVIQRELDFLRPSVLRSEREKDVLRKLNSHNRQALAMEWEVVILGSLARLAKINHEKLVGSVRPDLLVSYQGEVGQLDFVADIVTISDTESEKQNPADFFFDEFGRVARKLGLIGGFDIRIADRQVGKYPDAKTKLLLPAKGKIPVFVEKELKPFFQKIKKLPWLPDIFEYDKLDVKIRVTYDPKKRGGITGGHASSAVPFSLKRNPLSAALVSKAAQLKSSRYNGLLGILVTDGGCHALRSEAFGLRVFSRDNLVKQFLETHRQISFVTTSHHETHGGYSKTEEKLFHKIFWQGGLPTEVTDNLCHLFNKAFKALPNIATAPQNAWLDIRAKKEISRGCALGAYNWTPSNKLTLSTRTLIGLLAGSITERQFKILFYRTLPADGGPLIHFFRHLIESHLCLARVSIDCHDEEDDDSISFEVGRSPLYDVVQKSSVGKDHCDVPLKIIAQYFAGLDYSLSSGTANYSYIGSIPDEVRTFLKTMTSEGRMLVDAYLINDSRDIRFVFGQRDAAIAEYF